MVSVRMCSNNVMVLERQVYIVEGSEAVRMRFKVAAGER
jgi:hypothetical protein